MKKHLILTPMLIATAITPIITAGCSCNNQQFDFKQMRSDYISMLKDTVDTSASKMELDKLVDDGEGNLKFSDLDYSSQDRAKWPAQQHLIRAIPIAVDAAKRNDNEQHAKAVKLVKHWLKHDYQNPNWWCVEIGAPRDLSDTAMFVYEDLDSSEQTKLIEIIRRGSLLHNTSLPAGRKTGTNLFWFGDISMKDAWLTNDTKEFELMFKLVSEEIKENEQDGFQSDGSYYQHDHQLYNGGYGRQGAILLAKIMSAFVNTNYQWPTDKLQIIVNFILNGLATTVQKGYTDYLTMGRTYSRKEANQLDGGQTDLGNILLLKYIADLPNCPQKDKVKEVINAWENSKVSFNGIKYLDRSNMILANLDGIYMSFKGTNSKMRNSEKGNGENMLGYNLSYGTNTCVMETGKEYFDISPVWDFSCLPGTTALSETDDELDTYDNESHIRRKLSDDGGYTVYNGGTIDNVTFSMQKSLHEFTHFTVTCFATQDGLILMGSGLESRMGPLHTTVEQCIVNSGITPTISADSQTVEHGNVVYTNLSDGDSFNMTANNITNSWHRNNRSFDVSDTATKKVLKVTITHPDNRNYYAYIIQPKSKVVKKYKVVANTDNVHAILLPNNKIAAAFYEDNTSFEYGGKTYSGNKGEYKIF